MANPIKDTTHPRSPPESDLLNKPWNNPAADKIPADPESAQTGSTIIYIILAIALVIGGFYLYSAERPAATGTPTITKMDTAPQVDAPGSPTPAVPGAPPAATPPAPADVPVPATKAKP